MGRLIISKKPPPYYRMLTDDITLTASDDRVILTHDSATDVTVTIPDGLLQDFQIAIARKGSGIVTLTFGGNVTIGGVTATDKTINAASMVSLIFDDLNSCFLLGGASDVV